MLSMRKSKFSYKQDLQELSEQHSQVAFALQVRFSRNAGGIFKIKHNIQNISTTIIFPHDFVFICPIRYYEI